MKLGAKSALLRIVINRAPGVQTWILQGRLAGEAVDELTTTWSNTRSERAGSRCVVDLVDVTSVDEFGERALMQMMTEGAQFIARGVYTQSLLNSLREGSTHRQEEAM